MTEKTQSSQGEYDASAAPRRSAARAATAMLLLVGAILFGAAVVACRRGEPPEERGYSALNARTRIVRTGPYELAFELMDMPTHMEMMRRMNLAMNHGADAKYVLMLTIIDRRHDRLVRNAAVEFVFAQEGPRPNDDAPGPGARLSSAVRTHTARGMIMPGEKMFHYAADFPWSQSGVYSIRTVIRTPNTEQVQQQVEFEL